MGKEKKIALVGGTLIDGSGNKSLRDAIVLVNGHSIQDVGQRQTIKVP